MEVFEISLYFDEKVVRGVFSPLVVTMRFQIYPKTLQHPLPASTVLEVLRLPPQLCYGSKLGIEQSPFQETTSYVLRKLRTHPQLWLLFYRIP